MTQNIKQFHTFGHEISRIKNKQLIQSQDMKGIKCHYNTYNKIQDSRNRGVFSIPSGSFLTKSKNNVLNIVIMCLK